LERNDVTSPIPWPNTICISTSVRRADRALTRVYDDALRPTGLVTTQFSLLSIVARAPGPLTLGDLAEAQVMDRTTLTRNLAPLVREGLVLITPGDDRRTRVISLTALGGSTLDEARPRWQEAQEAIIRDAGSERIEHLLDELTSLVEHVRQGRQGRHGREVRKGRPAVGGEPR